MQTVRK